MYKAVNEMKDIQNQVDHRRINIKKVGVKTITYPITVLDRFQHQQKTIATVNMYVNLPHQFKGTHMSRFVEILNRFHGRIDIKSFHSILEEMKKKLNAEAAHVEMAFPFFLHDGNDDQNLQVKQYQCAMHCSLEEEDDLRLDLVIPVSGALDRDRQENPGLPGGFFGKVEVSVRFLKFMWLEELIDIVESVVKNQMQAEDLVSQEPMELLLGNISDRFSRLAELAWYSITVENEAHGYSLFTTMTSQ